MIKRFSIDNRYIKVNLTLSIIVYSLVVPFCVYLCIDNYIRGDFRVADYALFCALMTTVAVIILSVCKFGKKERPWLMHIALNIQCIVYWITFLFFLYTGGTDGTSIFLFFLAPPVVFFFFNLFYGLYFCLVFFVIMALYMNTPVREIGYAFPEVYYSRLPMMYLVDVVMCAVAQYEVVKARIKQEKALDDARRASEAKTDFLANTSHEIRTPINAVLGMNEMILRESSRAEKLRDASPEMYREAFRNIKYYSGNVNSAGNNLLAIINDILDLTKIEEGKMDIVEVDYQLSSVLNDISNMIYFRASGKNLRFETDIDSNLPDGLYGDAVRVRQIMTNILTNAVKYTDEGGVTFKMTGTDAGRSADGRDIINLQITVSDTGIGISKEDLGKLFAKFERLDLERNSTKEGTGLGLAITKRLLDMMNGSIEVESEYGWGSTFKLTIPQVVTSRESIGNFKEKFEKSLGEKAEYHESFRAPDAKILIVDDTRMNLIVATQFLKDTGLNIDTAGGGREAVELSLESKYDVILMDQRMPEMDGAAALKEIKSHTDGPNIDTPVICLTADAVIGAKERYLAKGFNDYLTKPIDSVSLESMLRKYLPADKVIRASEIKTEEAGAEEAASYGELSVLIEAGVDVAQGIAHCGGDIELYHVMLQEYVSTFPDKKEILDNSLAEGDLELYGVNVHSLKSTSAVIGAESVRTVAAKLEKAAMSGENRDLTPDHEDLMRLYESVMRSISSVITDDVVPAEDNDGDILEFVPD